MGEDNEPHPCLAASWDVSADGKSYTFHLRSNVKFHSGRTFEAADFKRSIERACNPVLAAPLAADYLSDIEGVRSYAAGKSAGIAGIQVLDTGTLRVSLDAPRPYFLAKLTCPAATVVDCGAIRDGLHVRTVDEMAGTGPFRIEQYVDGQLLVQRAFDGYWGGRPKIDEIRRPVMRDEAERISAFQRGELDMLPQISRANYVAFAADPKTSEEAKLIPRATLVYFALNTKTWPNRRVRQALARAIDVDQIASDTMLGTVTAAKCMIPLGVPGHSENHVTWPGHDLARARDILREEEHPGAQLPALHISYTMDNPDIERIADRIGSQIREGLGVQVVLDRMDTATLIAKQSKGDLDCVVSGWFADYLDPQDFVSMLLTSSSPENHWHYRNPDFDRRCAQADVEQNAELRLALYAGAEDLALADAVLIPICYWRTPCMIGRRVAGVRHCAGQFLPYESVRLK